MPGKTIDELPIAGALTGTEELPLRTQEQTSKTTVDALAAYALAGSAFQTAINAAMTPYNDGFQSLLAQLADYVSQTQSVLTTMNGAISQSTTINTTQAGLITALTDRVVTLEQTTIPNSGSAPTNSGGANLPTLTGTVSVGQTLTVVPGTWSGTIVSRTYTFRRGNTIVRPDGAGTTYVIQPADGGGTITVTETVHSAFPDASVTSIGYVVGAAPAVPAQSAPPTISGTAASGQTLTGNHGTYTNSPTSYAYRWLRSGAPISGATSQTYVVQPGDVGLPIVFGETPSNATGPAVVESVSSSVVVSGATPPAYDDNSVQPGIKAGTRQVGTQLQGDVGAASNNPDPTLYLYQWYRNDAAISGAVSVNYTPVTADGDKQLQFGVIPRNAGGAGTEARSPGVYIAP